jgi:hypothetical protein
MAEGTGKAPLIDNDRLIGKQQKCSVTGHRYSQQVVTRPKHYRHTAICAALACRSSLPLGGPAAALTGMCSLRFQSACGCSRGGVSGWGRAMRGPGEGTGTHRSR